MKILICNERFLFRFGVDRVLLILAKGLTEHGHTVTLMGNRFDHAVARQFSARVIEAPAGADDYLNLNEFTQAWLAETWLRHFNEETSPDIVLVGGWPFFKSMPYFRKKGARVVFLDCGAVPLEGYTGGALLAQQKVRELRKQYLTSATCITAISDFIAKSQSKVDSQGAVPVRTVLLGADHMEMTVWPAETTTSSTLRLGTAP